MSKNTLVELHNVGLAFKQQRILDKISFQVHNREILTVIGPNGAGKSCLLKIILGLYKPSEGICSKAAGLRIGYMPQKLTLDSSLPLSVERFLSLANPESKDIVNVLGKVGSTKLLKTPVQKLSGGEFQRVLLARALLREPDLLVLDEPAQGVDLQGQQALYHLLAKLRDEQGFAILMVSHDLHFVMAQTDRVLCLNQHVCCSGTAEAVSKHPEYLRLFDTGSVEDIAVYTHHHDHHYHLDGHVVDGDHEGCKHD